MLFREFVVSFVCCSYFVVCRSSIVVRGLLFGDCFVLIVYVLVCRCLSLFVRCAWFVACGLLLCGSCCFLVVVACCLLFVVRCCRWVVRLVLLCLVSCFLFAVCCLLFAVCRLMFVDC